MEVAGEATDGRQAVEVARDVQPDAVILDVEMPVLDGLQALPGLARAAPNAKVVVFSSRADPETAAAARSPGVAGVFYKGHHKSREVVAFLRGLFPLEDD
jgi:DNA-binding NarL/FixJ family response regulator